MMENTVTDHEKLHNRQFAYYPYLVQISKHKSANINILPEAKLPNLILTDISNYNIIKLH